MKFTTIVTTIVLAASSMIDAAPVPNPAGVAGAGRQQLGFPGQQFGVPGQQLGGPGAGFRGNPGQLQQLQRLQQLQQFQQFGQPGGGRQLQQFQRQQQVQRLQQLQKLQRLQQFQQFPGAGQRFPGFLRRRHHATADEVEHEDISWGQNVESRDDSDIKVKAGNKRSTRVARTVLTPPSTQNDDGVEAQVATEAVEDNNNNVNNNAVVEEQDSENSIEINGQ